MAIGGPGRGEGGYVWGEIAGKKHVFFEYVDIHPLYIHGYTFLYTIGTYSIYIPIPPRDIFFSDPLPLWMKQFLQVKLLQRGRKIWKEQ